MALARAINQVLGFEAANDALKTSLIIRQRSPLTYTHYAPPASKTSRHRKTNAPEIQNTIALGIGLQVAGGIRYTNH